MGRPVPNLTDRRQRYDIAHAHSMTASNLQKSNMMSRFSAPFFAVYGSFKAPVTLDLPTLVFRATFDPAGTDVTIAQSPILPLALARTIEGG